MSTAGGETLLPTLSTRPDLGLPAAEGMMGNLAASAQGAGGARWGCHGGAHTAPPTQKGKGKDSSLQKTHI